MNSKPGGLLCYQGYSLEFPGLLSGVSRVTRVTLWSFQGYSLEFQGLPGLLSGVSRVTRVTLWSFQGYSLEFQGLPGLLSGVSRESAFTPRKVNKCPGRFMIARDERTPGKINVFTEGLTRAW